uniref:Protein phosphatase n=1 Tax=Salix viminalis TaxID=40686 RepID=A0A6N2NDN1_SALVM
MAMITVFRASISRSLPNCFPNLLSSSSNRNSAPKKNKLLCYAASSHTKTIRSEMSFCVGTHMIPHPKKVERGGEDSFFVSDYNGGVIAVADGVSGWAERNVDPSLFPQELMANASCLVGDEEVSYDPQILIRKAHAATSAVGSATVRMEN